MKKILMLFCLGVFSVFATATNATAQSGHYETVELDGFWNYYNQPWDVSWDTGTVLDNLKSEARESWDDAYELQALQKEADCILAGGTNFDTGEVTGFTYNVAIGNPLLNNPNGYIQVIAKKTVYYMWDLPAGGGQGGGPPGGGTP